MIVLLTEMWLSTAERCRGNYSVVYQQKKGHITAVMQLESLVFSFDEIEAYVFMMVCVCICVHVSML